MVVAWSEHVAEWVVVLFLSWGFNCEGFAMFSGLERDVICINSQYLHLEVCYWLEHVSSDIGVVISKVSNPGKNEICLRKILKQNLQK